MGRFQTYPSTWYYCQLVSARTTQKELATRKIHRRDYKTLPKNPDFPETTRLLIKSTQISKKGDNNSENKIFSITNIFKGYKITDITRPNELGTTTNKVATRNPVELGSETTTCL
jgi:hypothetical protein